MFQSEHLQEKWSPLLDYEGLDPIKDAHRRSVTAVLLENQEKFLREEQAFSQGINLMESPTNSGNAAGASGGFGAGAEASGPVAGFDPVLISLIRRSMPNLVAYDLAGVQPMTGPTGLIFAMRAKYGSQAGGEALFNEADTDFAGDGTHANTLPGGAVTTGTGMTTAAAEALGDGAGTNYAEMAFSIEKVTVAAKTRALKAEYTTELAQDLKAVHGLDAETELANILQTEILTEINREVIRTIYDVAVVGAAGAATPGTFDLDVDANGRWSVEKFKGLMFALERDANAVGQQTRRGKGNIIICSADVASALQMAGVLDYTPALNNNLNVDDTSTTFAGVMNGRFKVYVDPYAANVAASQYYVVGYKGTSPYDAGVFYCPYVPLQMVRAVGENTFQPKIGFKTRYGIAANPFHTGVISAGTAENTSITANTNKYYRRVKVTNLM
mgnify:CR=1 FL=1